MTEYSVSSNEKWTFYATHTYKKDDVYIDLTLCCKYGIINLQIDEDDSLPTEFFNSENYTKENQFQVEDTGEEEFHEIEVYSSDGSDHDDVYDWFENEYDPNSEDYFGHMEFLEDNNWEYIMSSYYFENPIITKITE